MAGSGFAQHAINVVKNNRALLRSRDKRKKTKDDVFGTEAKTKLNLKESSPSDILKVKRQMEEYNRQLRIKGFIAGTIVFVLIVLVSYVIYIQT